MINVNRDVTVEPIVKNAYRTIEILKALGIVFKNKCYLCEKKDTSPGIFDVEHFETQKEAVEKKYIWSNLYLACHICNGIKPKISPIEGFLDVCNPDEDVEEFIGYEFDSLEYDKPIFYTIDPSQKTKNTVKLLKKLHFGHNPNSKLRTASLREAINRQAKKVLSTIVNYKKAANIGDRGSLQIEERNLRIHFSKESPFTMLMRSFGNEYELQHFFD